jgi:hypothetical protein
MTDEDWTALRGAQISARLPEGAVAAVLGTQTPLTVQKGAILRRQGDATERCFLLREGPTLKVQGSPRAGGFL